MIAQINSNLKIVLFVLFSFSGSDFRPFCRLWELSSHPTTACISQYHRAECINEFQLSVTFPLILKITPVYKIMVNCVIPEMLCIQMLQLFFSDCKPGVNFSKTFNDSFRTKISVDYKQVLCHAHYFTNQGVWSNNPALTDLPWFPIRE